MAALVAMLASDVAKHSDGGGKRPAAVRPIFDSRLVLRLHKALAVLFRKQGSQLVGTCFITGLPGFVTRETDGELQTTALDIAAGRVIGIYVMRNPNKMKHLH